MRKIAIIVLVFNMIFMSGCWDLREINELGLVMAVGIDKADNSNNYIVTVQIANPRATSPMMGLSAGTSNKIWVASAEGATIFDAIRELVKISSKRIMWAHNNVIIIGESLARDSISPVIDFFTHNPELRMKTLVLVSNGNAKEYIAIKGAMEDIPAISLAQASIYSNLIAESLYTDMLKLSNQFYSQEMQPIISTISIKNPIIPTMESINPKKETEVIEISGTAIFKKDKLVGFLSPEETKGIAWILNNTEKTLVTVNEPQNITKKVSVETTNVKSKTIAEIRDGIPCITIKVTGNGSIAEEGTETSLNIDEFKKNVKKLVDSKISEEIYSGVNKVQKQYNSDVLYFGKTVHVQHNKEWESNLKKNWENIFPNIPVTVLVDINIIDSTLNQEPFKVINKKG